MEGFRLGRVPVKGGVQAAQGPSKGEVQIMEVQAGEGVN